ncbi:MAG: hypothetical protein JWQ48_1114 [Conexibacter sp.]|nr:hypothetical protein [Conexibacter sp.]
MRSSGRRQDATPHARFSLRVALLALVITLVGATAAQAATTSVVLGFDGGLASQYANRAVLTNRGVHATFFVSSGKVGRAGYMTWAQLTQLQADGHEIGSNGVDRVALPPLTTAQQQHQACDDRTALQSHSLTVRNFAYPGGQTNAAVKAVLAGCGYDTARTAGGLDYPDPCCVYAETVPPRDARALRAIQPQLSTPLSVYQDAINAARNGGGGVFDLVLHDICTGTCAGAGSDAISTATLSGLLDWIATLPDVQVRSTAQAFSTSPPAPVPDRSPPTVALTAPVDRSTVAPGPVTLSADASDDVGVARVDFLVAGTVVGSTTTAPYTVAWDASRAGASATITARATDRAGNATVSAARTVTVLAPPAPTGPLTYVTLGFDDGLASQYANRGVLSDHGVHATFFANSGHVGQPGYVTWAQLTQMQTEGHEIGGHTVDHAMLTAVSAAEQQHQICDDRTTLLSHGLAVTDFAYPFGASNAGVQGVAAGCGYTSARTTGGTDYPDPCCVYAETTPPRNAFALRAWEPRFTTPLATFEDVIQRARDTGGGSVNIVLHDLCTGACTGADDYTVDVATLDALLTWIAARPDVQVRTAAQVLAIRPDTGPPTVALTSPAAGAQVSGTVSLQATASDNVGVSRVDFVVDGETVGIDTTAPYSFDWDSSSTPVGPLLITARARDAAGNVTTATSRTVRVVR